MMPTRLMMSPAQKVRRVRIADSGPETVARDDCLTCLDTEDAAVNSVYKKF